MVSIVGKAPEFVQQARCRQCASVLEYTRGEVKKRTEKDYTQCIDTIRFIICPSCGSEVTVK